MKQYWTLDIDITFLNHSSFGMTSRVVLKDKEFVSDAGMDGSSKRRPVTPRLQKAESPDV